MEIHQSFRQLVRIRSIDLLRNLIATSWSCSHLHECDRLAADHSGIGAQTCSTSSSPSSSCSKSFTGCALHRLNEGGTGRMTWTQAALNPSMPEKGHKGLCPTFSSIAFTCPESSVPPPCYSVFLSQPSIFLSHFDV